MAVLHPCDNQILSLSQKDILRPFHESYQKEAVSNKTTVLRDSGLCLY